jgi:hypothetical protein
MTFSQNCNLIFLNFIVLSLLCWFTRQDGETITSHYLKYANLTANLQPAMSQEDLVGALTSHYPIVIQRSLISGNIKTTQDAIYLLGKLDALEARDDYRNPRQNSENHDASRRSQHNPRGDRTDRNQRDVYGYSMCNTRMGPTMTGGQHTVRRIDTTEHGTTTLAGGNKKNGGLAVGHTTAAYP